MELKTYFAQDAAGNIISSAIVNIFLQGTTTLATGLTRADGTPLDNPFAADGAGRIQFRAPDGYYDVQVSAGSGIMQTLTIQCVDYSGAKAESDRATTAANNAEISAEKAGSYVSEVASMLPLSFMSCGAIGDGTYHPLSEIFNTLADAQITYPHVTSLTQSIDWAAAQLSLNQSSGRKVDGSGSFVFTDTLDTSTALFIEGGGVADWTPGYNALIRSGGTQWAFYGTGERKWTVDHISNRSTGGGVIANPASADSYTANAPAQTYELLDFTNQDAVGAQKATLKPFSVGLYVRNGCRISNIRVVPYFNGIAGYQSSETGSLGDEWDVGVWEESARSVSTDNIQAVGYWRIAGYLKTNSQTVSGAPTGENGIHLRPTFQGYRGFAARANDVYRITSSASNSISIPWSKSHRFNTSGSVRVAVVEYAYTGLSFSGDKLTFTGVTPSAASISAGTELRIGGSNFGVSGTQLIDPYITGLEHSSRLMATCRDLSKPFATPSACIELDGDPLRAIQINDGTIITREDILVFAPNIDDLNYSGTYFESQAARSSLSASVFASDIPAGSRIIYARQSTSTRATYPAGGTKRLIVSPSCTYGPGVDLRPDINRPDITYAIGRYTTAVGLCEARDFIDLASSFPTASDGDIILAAPNRHVRLRTGSGGSVLVGPTDGDANLQSAVGSLNLLSGLRQRFGSAAGAYWAVVDSTKISPISDNVMANGAPTTRYSASYAAKRMYTATVGDFYGTTSPEGVVTAGVGSTYRKTIEGGASSSFYVKETGTGNTGWVAK